jgi:tRNA(Ile)-lysidine synthase
MARDKTVQHKSSKISDDDRPLSAADAAKLFAGFADAPALVLAVSGGPDSMALMWLAARWRKVQAKAPQLVAVTVDHGLRPEAAREARAVKQVARSLDLPHRTLRWHGDKPTSGVPEAARAMRYHLLAKAAKAAGASHILTAHTRDDQAETLLMRLLRGSGIAGLAAMAAVSEREGLLLARPLLDVPKARLIATLKAVRLDFADDPTNRDTTFTRPRLRALMPTLAAEGGDTRNLARLAARLARANAAIEVLADGAERYLALIGQKSSDAIQQGEVYDARAFARLPDEVRLRLLMRAIDRFGTEGPVELGKAEILLAALDQTLDQTLVRTFAGTAGGGAAAQGRLKQTLAGALVSVGKGWIRITPAPPRRLRRS